MAVDPPTAAATMARIVTMARAARRAGDWRRLTAEKLVGCAVDGLLSVVMLIVLCDGFLPWLVDLEAHFCDGGESDARLGRWRGKIG